MPSVGGGSHGGVSHSSAGSHGSSVKPGYYVRGFYIPSSPRGRYRKTLSGPLCIIGFVLVFAILFFVLSTTSFNESAFEELAFEKYDEVYSKNDDYEKNVLVLMATKQDSNDYYYISIVGDDIDYPINLMFGNDSTPFGHTLHANIPTDFINGGFDTSLKNTLDILGVIISTQIENDKTDLNKTEDQKMHFTESNENLGKPIIEVDYLLNYDSNIVQEGIDSFKVKTGIALSFCVIDQESCIGLETTNYIIVLVVLLIFMAIGIYALITSIKALKEFEKAEREGTTKKFYRDSTEDAINKLKEDI